MELRLVEQLEVSSDLGVIEPEAAVGPPPFPTSRQSVLFRPKGIREGPFRLAATRDHEPELGVGPVNRVSQYRHESGIRNSLPDSRWSPLIVSLPGEPSEHNADEELADGSLSWDIPFDGELYVFAETEYPSGGFPWWLVALLAISGGFALAVWLAAARRDRKTGDVRRAAPEPPPVTPSDQAKQAPQPESPFFELE